MQVEVDEIGREITTRYQCDICGKVSVYRTTCGICNRDICTNCTFFDPRWRGDCTDTYCESCFDIGKEYFDRMNREHEKFDALMEEIEKEWKNKAIKAVNLTKDKTGEKNKNDQERMYIMSNEKDKNGKNDGSEERTREYNLKIAYKNGIIEGMRRYSWWEEGVQYIGTSKKKLESAIQEVEKEYEGFEP